jgi:hypothetical protein
MGVEREFLIENRKGRVRMYKKIWFIGIICFVLALSTGILNSEAISKQTRLKVESLYKFVEKFGEYQPELLSKDIYEYDSEGNRVKETSYMSKLGLMATTTFEYDEKGDKASEEIEYAFGSELVKETYEHRYDEKGNKIEVSAYNAEGELNAREVYKHDEMGNRIEISKYGLDGELVGKSIFEFDEKGREMEWDVIDIMRMETKLSTFIMNTNLSTVKYRRSHL